MSAKQLQQIFQVLIDCWKFDVWVFGQWWMYAPLLIPALAYLGFFFLKWSVLTAPVWLPLYLFSGRWRR